MSTVEPNILATIVDIIDWDDDAGRYRALFVIRPHKTGIVYTNQTGGVACNHPEVEGYIERVIPYEGKTCLCTYGTDARTQMAVMLSRHGYVLDMTDGEEGWLKTQCGAIVATENCD